MIARLRERIRARRAARPSTLALDQIQRRLDLLLTAMYGRSIHIAPIAKSSPHWIERLFGARPRESMPMVDGDAIHLPATLPAGTGVDSALARYRLLAVEQAERLTRGTANHVPPGDMLIRDLYLVREGMAIDERIARAMPGLTPTLAEERAAALARRPRLDRLTQAEREVELLLRNALSESLIGTHAGGAAPTDSLAWATETAATIRRRHGLYRGLPATAVWGTLASSRQTRVETLADRMPAPIGLALRSDSPGTSDLDSAGGDGGSGRDQAPSPVGAQLDSKAPPGGSDDNSRTGTLPDPSAPVRWSDLDAPNAFTGNRGMIVGDDSLQIVDEDVVLGLPPGTTYDEWDSDTSTYRRHAVTVREYEPVPGAAEWADNLLREHGALVRQVRQQFERLRARRMLLGRQRAGDDLDIAACVQAVVDRRLGEAPDHRLYVDTRPARRGLALALLVDSSGSTEAGVTADLRIIDLEKIALVLASQALDALGDLYAIYAFAGRNSSNVKVTTLKGFAERSGPTVNARIAGLNPGGFTRLGAAVRHATHRLARQSAGHRLLLILSDGRPNDMDRYQTSYGVEDARQAIMEARASGVYPFCLTVDSSASEYLPRIFGRAGHTILQRPEQLPASLLGAVRALIRRG